MPTDPLDDLAEARSKIKTTRAALPATLDGQEFLAAVRQVIERLERVDAGIARVEGVVEGVRPVAVK